MSDSPESPDSPGDFHTLLYDELRAIAAIHLQRERDDHTLQPTALVHEAFLRLQARGERAFVDRTHYLACASIAMRRVLVDHARARAALKRGGGATRVTASEHNALSDDRTEDVLSVDQALRKLAEVDEMAARVVEMRFFAGMTEAEAAAALGVSDRWVRKQWAFARAWLRRAMADG